MELIKVEAGLRKGEFHSSALGGIGKRRGFAELSKVASPLFLSFGSISLKDNAIAHAECSAEFDQHPFAAQAHDRPRVNAALGGTCRRNQQLVVTSLEPTCREAAREGEFHLFDIAWGE